MTKHIPVLFEEVREQLHLQKGMTVVDATLGGGGHASMMLAAIAPGKLIAFDIDREALSRFEVRVRSDAVLSQASKEGRLVLIQDNYSGLEATLKRLGVDRVDAILADLGFSSDQIETPERGFSFQEDGPLDMRLSQETTLTARDIVNTYSREALAEIFTAFGDESEGFRLAGAIVEERSRASIETTQALARLIAGTYPKRKRAIRKIHPATKTFQALRIAVNQEFEHLEQFLEQAVDRLAPSGRLAIITFHSGEDKRVKRFLREHAQGCICPPNFPVCRCGQVPRIRILTKRPIVPEKAELARNPRSRSAKLRVAERV